MKTRGKIAIEEPENDFKVVDSLLKDGLSRLMAVKENAKLSAEQQKVFDSTFAQIRVLQAAMKECGDVERFAAPEVRNEQMGQTIARYNIQKLNGFDDVFACFGNQEIMAEREAAGIDRDLALADLVAGIHGTGSVAESDYQGGYYE